MATTRARTSTEKAALLAELTAAIARELAVLTAAAVATPEAARHDVARGCILAGTR